MGDLDRVVRQHHEQALGQGAGLGQPCQFLGQLAAQRALDIRDQRLDHMRDHTPDLLGQLAVAVDQHGRDGAGNRLPLRRRLLESRPRKCLHFAFDHDPSAHHLHLPFPQNGPTTGHRAGGSI